MVIFQFVIF